MRRLRSAAATLERTTRQVEEAGSRLQVLVEHVPAAVYIDMADPDVSDGGRLAYMSPQISGILGYRPDELVDDPEPWPSRIHPDDRDAAIATYGEHWQTGQPLRDEAILDKFVGDGVMAIFVPALTGEEGGQRIRAHTSPHSRLYHPLGRTAVQSPSAASGWARGVDLIVISCSSVVPGFRARCRACSHECE